MGPELPLPVRTRRDVTGHKALAGEGASVHPSLFRSGRSDLGGLSNTPTSSVLKARWEPFYLEGGVGFPAREDRSLWGPFLTVSLPRGDPGFCYQMEERPVPCPAQPPGQQCSQQVHEGFLGLSHPPGTCAHQGREGSCRLHLRVQRASS